MRRAGKKLNSLWLLIALLNSTNGFGQPDHNASFKKQVITTDFVSEGVAVGDVNRDGKPDIMAGAFWFEAPAWKRHEITPGKVFDPDKDYSHSFLNHASDVNEDGWVDLMVVDFPGTIASWFENPQNKTGYWSQHYIYSAVANESPTFADVNRDGRTDLICADPDDRQMIWLRSPLKGAGGWEKFTISQKNVPGTEIFSHGLGWGDINGDGRNDVIIREGWWQGPEDVRSAAWRFHPADLGDECSQMYALDVNADGSTDVISASAHLSGIWWHEQVKNQDSVIWEQHVISYAFAESHAVAMADFNGDGKPDMVTGKRNLKRNTWRKNPGTHGPPLLYWFEFTPGTEPYWIAHEIDNASGAGLNIAVHDINRDGKNDIIIANMKGIFIFENQMKK